MHHRLIILILLALVVIFATFSCSSKKDPVSSDPPDNPVVIDTGGVATITGNPTDTAAKALPFVAPHPVPADKIDEDGFMRTRLQGALNPTATVETVNTALTAANAVITFYDTTVFSISLRIPEQTTREAADSLAATLVNSGAFLFLFAGQSVSIAAHSSVAIIPQRPLWTIRHQRKMRMPAAWHVRQLASTNSQQVRVIVPDEYASSNPHPEIPSLSFLTGNGTIVVATNGPNGIVIGNHGYHVVGTIGAAFDNIGSTGTHPGALQDISILALKLGGLGWNEIMMEISQSLPAMPCLVSTSLAYNVTIASRSKYQRALDAIMWRALVANRQNNFLMIAAAGNNGQFSDDSRFSQYSLPWNLAAAYASPDQMVPPGISVAERQALNNYFQVITTAIPAAANALTNVIVVGSSDTLGNLSSFSNTPFDVRAVGENVCAPCLMDDPGLDTMKCRLISGVTRALYDGTSMATPQITGLAAYLWNIEPTLSLQDLKTIITRSYDALDPVMPGVIDAYRAVLSLDNDLSNAPVRLALFDVAGSSGLSGSDGRFDEKDLALWFNEFENHKQNRINGADPLDYSRYDLNGNGISAIEAAWVDDQPQRFDLDVNDPPQFSTVTANDVEGQVITYNENTTTDLDILCYYAYSALYAGNEQQRVGLCTPCLGEFFINTTLADTLTRSVPANISFNVWRLVNTTDSIPVRGADLEVTVQGTTVSSFTGITDSTGTYTDEITPLSNADSVKVIVKAKLHNVVVATDTALATVQALGGGKVQFTRSVWTTKSTADVTFSPNGGEDVISDTSISPGATTETTTHSDANGSACCSGTATNTCTRNDDVSVSNDSTLMSINQTVTTTSASFGTAISATWGGNSTGFVDQFYEFEISQDSMDFSIHIICDYNESDDDDGGSGSYLVEVFEIINGTPFPFHVLNFTASDQSSKNDSLVTVLYPGEYRIRVQIGAGAFAGAEDNTANVSNELNTTTTIEVGSGQQRKRR